MYSAGATVTYYVDSDTAYTEEVDSEATCLSPTTFTPQKDGYTFVGWRQDKTASSEVIQSLTMGDDEITLYAVFTKNIALTYYSSETAETITKPEYYNCGNYSRAYFTVDAPALSGWTFEGWRYGVYNYSSFSNIMLSRDTTIYARYSKDISVNLVTGGDTLCWIASCSYIAPGTYDYGSVTQDDPTLDGWTFLGWTTGTSASADIVYATLNNTTFTANATLYAKYSKAITLTYYSTASTASTKTGTRYFNAYGNYSNPTFTINTPTLSGWTFEGWTTSSDATEAAEYSSISGTAFSEDTVLYGRWSQTITLTYYSKSSTSAAKTGTRYFNAAGNYSNPTFTVSDPSLSNWTFEGWAASASATASIAYESISSAEFSTDTTLYGKFSQSITLSYNGNSATSGSTDSQTKTRYFNTAGNYSNPSFTLASNGFTRSCYSFSKW
ncbi:MAG: InlB B-repeat-containing protein, partial [Lachnospiraceae bacterium]|nr:InlB B-repeat-containing protein [Lachnospiraceae bacterium]